MCSMVMFWDQSLVFLSTNHGDGCPSEHLAPYQSAQQGHHFLFVPPTPGNIPQKAMGLSVEAIVAIVALLAALPQTLLLLWGAFRRRWFVNTATSRCSLPFGSHSFPAASVPNI